MTQVRHSTSTLLHHTLRANALFSSGSGLAFTFLNQPISAAMGIQSQVVFGLIQGEMFLILTGLSLLPFALFLGWFSLQPRLDSRLVRGIIALDFAWVIGSALILVLNLLPLTTVGSWGVLIIADIVLTFALLQIWGLRRQARSSS